ncbi:hypothetical protein B0H21DRAFT_735219 [Amylocystis lapponica]|nr:hypothetical protein B0H21DRAFT_735219 [Amylocystis lapponica]
MQELFLIAIEWYQEGNTNLDNLVVSFNSLRRLLFFSSPGTSFANFLSQVRLPTDLALVVVPLNGGPMQNQESVLCELARQNLVDDMRRLQLKMVSPHKAPSIVLASPTGAVRLTVDSHRFVCIPMLCGTLWLGGIRELWRFNLLNMMKDDFARLLDAMPALCTLVLDVSLEHIRNNWLNTLMVQPIRCRRLTTLRLVLDNEPLSGQLDVLLAARAEPGALPSAFIQVQARDSGTIETRRVPVQDRGKMGLPDVCTNDTSLMYWPRW